MCIKTISSNRWKNIGVYNVSKFVVAGKRKKKKSGWPIARKYIKYYIGIAFSSWRCKFRVRYQYRYYTYIFNYRTNTIATKMITVEKKDTTIKVCVQETFNLLISECFNNIIYYLLCVCTLARKLIVGEHYSSNLTKRNFYFSKLYFCIFFTGDVIVGRTYIFIIYSKKLFVNKS